MECLLHSRLREAKDTNANKSQQPPSPTYLGRVKREEIDRHANRQSEVWSPQD